MTDELQDLDNLTKHPGWLRFLEHGAKDVELRLNAALTNAANNADDTLAINQVRQCIAVRQAIEALLQWPMTRKRALQATVEKREPAGTFSRRGDL